MSELTPEIADVEALREQVPDGPVVMLNLLKFREPDGRQHMAAYGGVTAPLIQKAGGEVVYAGECGPVLAGGDDWDTTILVRFPDIERFVEMINSADYRERAVPHRDAALTRTIWMVTRPAV